MARKTEVLARLAFEAYWQGGRYWDLATDEERARWVAVGREVAFWRRPSLWRR